MDAFMSRFHADLEKSLGVEMATSCLDIGVKNVAVLEEPFDWRRLRAEIAFFEFQFPFGLKGYRTSMPVPEAKGAIGTWLPRSVWRAYWRHKTVVRFFCSVTNSGRSRRPAGADGP